MSYNKVEILVLCEKTINLALEYTIRRVNKNEIDTFIRKQSEQIVKDATNYGHDITHEEVIRLIDNYISDITS